MVFSIPINPIRLIHQKQRISKNLVVSAYGLHTPILCIASAMPKEKANILKCSLPVKPH